MTKDDKQKSILVIGDVYSETQYFVEEIPSGNEFAISEDATSVFGSKTINASRTLARLGSNVDFFAHVGNDLEGVNSIKTFKDWEINSLTAQINNEKTGKIVVITDKSGKSGITLFRGANQTITPQIIAKYENKIAQYDAIYAATNLQLDSLYVLADLCHKINVPLFIDVPNQHNEIDLSRLSKVNFFAPNRQEAQLLTKTAISSIEDAKKVSLILRGKLTGVIIITLDKDGCIVLEENSSNPKHFKATTVDSVDETAAGDIFRAVFLHSFLKTKSIEQSITKALLVATESTKIKGVDKTLSTIKLNNYL